VIPVMPVMDTPPSTVSRAAPAWPAGIPGLGPRAVIPYTSCQDCVDQGGRAVQESVRLSFTGEVVSWTVSRVEGTFAAYGGRALCLAHARPRLDAAGMWGRETVEADVDERERPAVFSPGQPPAEGGRPARSSALPPPAPIGRPDRRVADG
jgi:hypothetical protein